MITAVRIFIGLVLVSAAIGKFMNIRRFIAALGEFELFSARAVAPAAVLVSSIEMLVGSLLLFGVALTWASALAAGLFMTFALVLALKLSQGQRKLQCGCFGGHTVLSWSHVVRNLSFMCLALSLIETFIGVRVLGAVLLGAGVVPLLAFHPRARQAGRKHHAAA